MKLKYLNKMKRTFKNLLMEIKFKIDIKQLIAKFKFNLAKNKV